MIVILRKNINKKDERENLLVSGLGTPDAKELVKLLDKKLNRTKKFNNRSLYVWDLIRREVTSD